MCAHFTLYYPSRLNILSLTISQEFARECAIMEKEEE
jgi:hypothetical protein